MTVSPNVVIAMSAVWAMLKTGGFGAAVSFGVGVWFAIGSVISWNNLGQWVAVFGSVFGACGLIFRISHFIEMRKMQRYGPDRPQRR